MKVHTDQKLEKLKQLRVTGHSIAEIVRELSIPKATVWHHVQNIKVPEKYISILRSKQGGSKNRSELEWGTARRQAQELISKIEKTEKMLIASCLYWAEGSKGDFGLSNTDPDLIRVFINCLREFGVRAPDLTVSVRIYEDIDPITARSFWSQVTGVPLKEIRSINILGGKKNGKLTHGMCRVRLKKAKLQFKLINAMREQIICLVKK